MDDILLVFLCQGSGFLGGDFAEPLVVPFIVEAEAPAFARAYGQSGGQAVRGVVVALDFATLLANEPLPYLSPFGATLFASRLDGDGGEVLVVVGLHLVREAQEGFTHLAGCLGIVDADDVVHLGFGALDLQQPHAHGVALHGDEFHDFFFLDTFM